MSALRDWDGNNFEEEVLQSSEPVFIFFCASWCGLCQTTLPLMAEIAEEYQGRAKMLRADVGVCPDTVERVGLDGIPALLIFHGGEINEQVMGVQTKQQIKDRIERFFAHNVF